MSGEKHYYVYILANPCRTPDTAMTNNLRRRLDEHKRKLVPGFTARYNINRLVYFEVFEDVRNGSIVRRKSNLGPEQNESRQSSPKIPSGTI
jgi:putative endonuclease